MKIASRFDEKYKLEKCPRCLNIGKNFRILDDDSLACLECGCHFDRKLFRDSLDVKAILAAQDKKYKCEVCDKVFGERIALAGHMRGECGKSADKPS